MSESAGPIYQRPKRAVERLVYGYDYTAQTAADGCTIASVTLVSATPAGLTIESPYFLAGSVCSAWLDGGTPGQAYEIVWQTANSDGSVYAEAVTLLVQ